jgi:hypothetical protein
MGLDMNPKKMGALGKHKLLNAHLEEIYGIDEEETEK